MRKTLKVLDKQGNESTFELEVSKEKQKDYWVSTLKQLSDEDNPLEEEKNIAPKFYGLDQKQAERRMISAVENDFEILEEKTVEP